MRTVKDVINHLNSQNLKELEPPKYDCIHNSNSKIALTCPSMSRHMSNEGWQIMLALQGAGYSLFGHNLENNDNDALKIVEEHKPQVLLVQDKREWDTSKELAVPEEYWLNVHRLKDITDSFKLTILKDSHQNPYYHSRAAEEMGCHAWVVYYHPIIVKHLAPYVRTRHLVRTYHTIDSKQVPAYSSDNRNGSILSGAISWHYPLRWHLAINLTRLPNCFFLGHPGYHSAGTHTNVYLQQLARHKVAICTTSIYGYALRKLIEATACGCIVITDLPIDDALPYIDGNMVRIEGKTSEEQLKHIVSILPTLYQEYDADKQKHYSDLAKRYYDYREMGLKLANDIEVLRRDYK